MKWWTWKKGRQEAGYEILTLVDSKRWMIDCYLIRYPKGAYIPPHRDTIETGERHYRFNFILWPAKEGGVLECEQSIFRLGPINIFRPDLALHSVTPVVKGVRYVFSIGWARKVKS